MKKFTGLLRAPTKRNSLYTPTALRHVTKLTSALNQGQDSSASSDKPEASIAKNVKLFCEHEPSSVSGDEVLHLPAIVEAAESSPQAAAAAAYRVRKYMNKDNYLVPYKQYNAIMLLRILVDNPGATFTKNIDSKFVETVKMLLRMSRDPSVQQLLRETLNSFEREKAADENLAPLINMWKKERELPVGEAQRGSYQQFTQAQTSQFAAINVGVYPHGGGPGHSGYHGRPGTTLPAPAELAGRIEEAKTSAKLLIQLSQVTPAGEFENNELIKEFAERCQSAQRSLHGYMNCKDPGPDEQTLQTLIETCEQLSLASSKHQRALLAARKTTNGGQPGDKLTSPGTAPKTTNTIDSNAQGTANPFSDAHQIPSSTLPAPLQPSNRGYNESKAPNPGTVELPDNSGVATREDEMFKTPSTPPNARQPAVQRSALDEDDDLYNTSPVADKTKVSQQAREAMQQPTASYVGRQDAAIAGVSMHGGNSPPPLAQHTASTGTWGESDSPIADRHNVSTSQGQGAGTGNRIKDDEPMSVAGVSGSGWQY